MTTKLWKLVAKMKEKRRKPAVCELNEKIYIFGGGPVSIEFFDGLKWEVLNL